MSEHIFTNPSGAYGITDRYCEVGEFLAGGTISRGQIVQLATGATSVTAAAGATDKIIVGVALDDATSGKTVRVATKGFASTLVSGTNVAVDVAVSPTTGGLAHTATSTSGQWRVGFTREATGTTASAFKLVWVQPHIHQVGA